MSGADLHLPQLQPLGKTSRTDMWWVQPLLTFLGLGAFIVYSTWAAMQGVDYFVKGTHYLSPMYSPVLFDSWMISDPSGHAWFGRWPDWLPKSMLFIPLTPAFLILWAPGGFRFTCYYYRGAYYKAFWSDPISCSVGEPRGLRYLGERWFPLVLQNLHRYAAYIALIFIGLLSYDVWLATWFDAPGGGKQFGVGLGTLVLAVNVVLIACYTFGCHSLRHLVGGRLDEVSKAGVSQACYNCSSALNGKHQLFAYLSMASVVFSDVFVRLCSMGIWSDVRFL
jgi:hypothetical protein